VPDYQGVSGVIRAVDGGIGGTVDGDRRPSQRHSGVHGTAITRDEDRGSFYHGEQLGQRRAINEVMSSVIDDGRGVCCILFSTPNDNHGMPIRR